MGQRAVFEDLAREWRVHSTECEDPKHFVFDTSRVTGPQSDARRDSLAALALIAKQHVVDRHGINAFMEARRAVREASEQTLCDRLLMIAVTQCPRIRATLRIRPQAIPGQRGAPQAIVQQPALAHMNMQPPPFPSSSSIIEGPPSIDMDALPPVE